MPRGDGTGPAGRGPLTGRGAGYCAGYNVPGCANLAAGKGLGLARGYRGGRGPGGGRGAVRPAGTPPVHIRSPRYYGPKLSEDEVSEQELENLERTAEELEVSLNAVRERINQLETEAD